MPEKKIRDPVLEKYKSTWLTKKGHELARKMKARGDGSMMQIIEDALVEKYEKGKK